MTELNQESPVVARQLIIPADTLVCYKIFPGSAFDMSVAQLGQSSADWSALYAQFSLDHAIAYLPNHFDRGHAQTMLVSLRAKRPLKCFLYADRRYCDVGVSSAVKASLLRKSVCDNIDSRIVSVNKPLLEAIGEVHDMFVAIYDADTLLECAIPHCFMNSDNFHVKVHAVFSRDSHVSWMVGSAITLSSALGSSSGDEEKRNDLKLTKDERADMSLLSARVQASTQLDRCTWIDRITNPDSRES